MAQPKETSSTVIFHVLLWLLPLPASIHPCGIGQKFFLRQHQLLFLKEKALAPEKPANILYNTCVYCTWQTEPRMEGIIFCGIQAAGKSTFYSHHFMQTHLRISMDLLRTRNRERRFLDLCLQTRQPFVIDNTNPSAEERCRYIEPALAAGFRLTAYYFDISMGEAIRRNAARSGRAKIPVKEIGGTRKRLEVPKLEEGFSRLYTVQLQPNNYFTVAEISP